MNQECCCPGSLDTWQLGITPSRFLVGLGGNHICAAALEMPRGTWRLIEEPCPIALGSVSTPRRRVRFGSSAMASHIARLWANKGLAEFI